MKTLKHFPIKTFITALAFTVLGMMAVNANAAGLNYFLKFDGIDGESTYTGHEKWTNIDSFSWGASNSSVGGRGAGAGAGKPEFSPFSWTQQLDKSVPPLFMALVGGKHFKTATLEAVKPRGDRFSSAFFQMKFDEVLLTKLDFAGSGSRTVDVAGAFDSFTKITMTYKPELGNGSGYGPAIIGGWDIRKNGAPAFFGSPLALQGLFLAQPTTPVPAPAAMWLLGSGLLGLMGVARRKAV